MIKTLLLSAASTALASALPSAPPSPPPSPAMTSGHSLPASARLPFAASLAQVPVTAGPQLWSAQPPEEAWHALATATPDTRQETRWAYARSLIAKQRWAEALGVLEVMRQDDDDLKLVDAWRIAYGAALTGLGRPAEGEEMLGTPSLAANAEACAWRMRAMGEAGLGSAALESVNCAIPAVNARPGAERAPFLLAAARAAIAAGRAGLALDWLKGVPDREPAANLLRGRALMALGSVQEARLRLARVEESGSEQEKYDARLSRIEGLAARRLIAPAAALNELDAIRFAWRGDDIEQRALTLGYQLALDTNQTASALRTAATLYRYFDMGAKGPPLLSYIQSNLSGLLQPDNPMPLTQAAGLYWDLRDLAPSGAEGDLLVSRLADRLQEAGLYGRAADLLRYQLTARAKDVAQGPLSVKVAALDILSGHPERAILAVRNSEGPIYPKEMLWDRARVTAVALQQLGKTQEALAALDGVPDGARVKAEIFWKQHDWAALIGSIEPALPRAGALDDVAQATVLRYAVALAMVGREDKLQVLRARYGASFAKLPCAPAFEMLTRSAGSVNVAGLSKAMALIPSASPAGSVANLLDVDPAAARSTS